ncbi:hypothetical protein JCM15519_16230 [Fundidesulfovibrio butyratiphilus]
MHARLLLAVKLGLLACLALTLWKGATKLPEVASVADPAKFFRDMENNAENSAIMKERHFDMNHETLKALEQRQAQVGVPLPPDSLATAQNISRAIGKAKAKDVRNADYVALAREALDRAKRMRDQGWRMGVLRCPAAPGTPDCPARAEIDR